MASRNYWNVEKWNGSIWVSDGQIYRINANLETNISSNQVKSKLLTGENVFVVPSTKYVKEPITFTWVGLDLTDSLILKIQNYVTNNDYIRITDQASATYTGKFITFQRVWLSGVDSSDGIDLQSIFEVMA